ncbi:hypothetical protein D915_009162 [Fasciola hepatica]|uniref:Secreted protein n=1 Tax=Fasciola hepatica TaxID=6192 RepID=A0A4E0QYR3_FASHE|nr:hypothetical protein D915_009162 [Fasciola hepatica]
MHIGRTTRFLSQRLAWLNTGAVLSLTSAVVSHPAKTNHTVNAGKALFVLYSARGWQSKRKKCCILAMVEPIEIRLHNHSLCARKQFMCVLHLPWPTLHPRTGHTPNEKRKYLK